MAQTRILQRRIRTVKNAKQITKALEVVAASRMRRILEFVEGSRRYGELAASIIAHVSKNPEVAELPYFAPVASDRPSLYVVFSSDRGQAGAFNSNLFNLTLTSLRSERQQPQIIVFGRKGTRFFSRLSNIELVQAFEDIADNPEANVFAPAINSISEGISSGRLGKVVIVYNQFISSLSQKATALQLLPVTLDEASQTTEPADTVYEFEPDTSEIIDEALRLYIEAKLMQCRIESAASEYAMRMVAMGNANRNATDLIDDLTLELNATRQAAITQEIAEITGGAAAIAA